MKKKFIAAFTVKDIVFLAIISAVTLCTCAVMPLVVSLQTMIFGIAQLLWQRSNGGSCTQNTMAYGSHDRQTEASFAG